MTLTEIYLYLAPAPRERYILPCEIREQRERIASMTPEQYLQELIAKG